MENTNPFFEVGEVVILQPPHPSAKKYWGIEAVVLRRRWSRNSEDAFGGYRSGWSYETDIPAPPPSDAPHHQHNRWVWCEYDLRKKYDAGMDFKILKEELNTPMEIENVFF